jgi:hypothetical protein
MIDYKQEIANYGKRLPTEEEKEIARNIFQRLYNKGFDFEFIYYAIKHLNGKNLADNIGLMFYKDFQEEVKLIIKNERRKEKEKQEQIKRIGEAYERFAN